MSFLFVKNSKEKSLFLILEGRQVEQNTKMLFEKYLIPSKEEDHRYHIWNSKEQIKNIITLLTETWAEDKHN